MPETFTKVGWHAGDEFYSNCQQIGRELAKSVRALPVSMRKLEAMKNAKRVAGILAEDWEWTPLTEKDLLTVIWQSFLDSSEG